MPSSFYNEIVKLLTSSFSEEDASGMIIEECRCMKIKPEDLGTDNGSLILLQLMSKLYGKVTDEEWNALDGKIKSLLQGGIQVKGRVRGIVLKNALEYVAVKRGKIGVEEIRRRIKVTIDFKAECWYSLLILDEMLFHINEVLGNGNSTRSRDLGAYVVSPTHLLTSHYWFGQSHDCTVEALSNINELLNLNNIKIEKEGNVLKVLYEDVNSPHFNDFLIGILEEICQIRKMTQSSIIGSNGGNVHSIVITHGKRGDN